MWNSSSSIKAFHILKLFYLRPRKSDTYVFPKVLLLLINVWQLTLPETELFQEKDISFKVFNIKSVRLRKCYKSKQRENPYFHLIQRCSFHIH